MNRQELIAKLIKKGAHHVVILDSMTNGDLEAVLKAIESEEGKRSSQQYGR